jgi:hypothetical protein
MLTRLIAASYAWLLEVALWVSLTFAGIAGYNATIPLMEVLGASPYPEFAWKIIGACAFIVVVFLILAIFSGPLLILLDIRISVKSIAVKMASHEAGDGYRPTERRDPTM